MTWLRMHRRSALICGLTLLVPVVLYLNVLMNFWGGYRAYQADIDRLNPRIARLRGLMEYEEQLRAASLKVDQQVLGLVYPAADDRATVSAILQKQVRDILTDAGLAVTNSQVLPVREQGNFDYVSVKLLVSGDMAALDTALAGIASYLPLVLVESMEVSPRRVGRGRNEAERQELTASLQLLSLRAIQ